ncbi:hypothetical protein ROHU_010663 [Labeo rohita]|uniref:Uncharacterized protein n=1 Tax=Labeo rohita TaxID=84645 RepID=A0A498M158_LABRO|nr:hypothetical protein ROHU_010663 [Labeo rohita]
MSLSDAQSVDLCVFSDASVKTISAVAYVRVVARDGLREVGFVLEKSRLAPWPDLTVPRLELCAAVMAVEIAEVITKEIEMELNSVSFYTDSKVVLDYIHNQSRCFYIYVNNRVQRIKQFTKPEQWHCVPSDENPADHGSCSVPASKLLTTTWLTGPPFLHGEPSWAPEEQISFELVHPDDDKEIRPELCHLRGPFYSPPQRLRVRSTSSGPEPKKITLTSPLHTEHLHLTQHILAQQTLSATGRT